VAATPVVQTKRLRLRRYSESDAYLLINLLGDPVTMQHWPEPPTSEQARAWHQRALDAYATPGLGRMAIELLDGTYIGDAGIVRAQILDRTENDLGYIIDKAFWRSGYGFEAALACFEYGRGHGQQRIVANMAADNLGSVRVAQQLGFTLEQRFLNPRNRDKETLLYAWHAP
jgi:[ribosomal protein S5]-alanine N-acetyltransferase